MLIVVPFTGTMDLAKGDGGYNLGGMTGRWVSRDFVDRLLSCD